MHRDPASSPPPEPDESARAPLHLDDSHRAFMKMGFIDRAQRKIFATVFSQYGLHPSQGFTLSMVVHRPGRAQRELADTMRIERATVTVTLQKLERGGFIRREPDPDDQRVMRIYPTQQGIEAEASITAEMQRFHAACSESLTPEQHAQLIGLLQQLEDTVVAYQEGINNQKE